jgi:hypothetical protein
MSTYALLASMDMHKGEDNIIYSVICKDNKVLWLRVRSSVILVDNFMKKDKSSVHFIRNKLK